MTVQEAIDVFEKPSDHIKTIHIKDKGKVVCREEIVYSAELVQAFEMAIKALEEQGAIERIVKSLEQFRKPVYKDEYGNNVANIESVFSIIKAEVERYEVN